MSVALSFFLFFYLKLGEHFSYTILYKMKSETGRKRVGPGPPSLWLSLLIAYHLSYLHDARGLSILYVLSVFLSGPMDLGGQV